MRYFSLMTANHELPKLIKEVEQGKGFLIIRRGHTLAKLVPHTTDPEWVAANRRMMSRLEEVASHGGFRVGRKELYDYNR